MSTQTFVNKNSFTQDEVLSIAELQTLRFLSLLTSRVGLKGITSKVRDCNLGVIENLCQKGLVDNISNMFMITEEGEAVIESTKVKIQ